MFFKGAKNMKSQFNYLKNQFLELKKAQKVLEILRENSDNPFINKGIETDLEIELKYQQTGLVEEIDKLYKESNFDTQIEHFLIEVDTFKI